MRVLCAASATWQSPISGHQVTSCRATLTTIREMPENEVWWDDEVIECAVQDSPDLYDDEQDE